jgi:tetratricopeptide (TPR) repeat protein
MSPTRTGISLLALLVLSSSTEVRAEQGRCVIPSGDEARRDEARQNFQHGQELFEARDYRAAMATFECSFRNVPHHSTLYNIARAAEFAGEFQQALEAWRGYLRMNPNAEDRAEIEDRIRGLETSIREAQSQPVQPAQPGVQPAQPAQPTWTPPPDPGAAAAPTVWETPTNAPTDVYQTSNYQTYDYQTGGGRGRSIGLGIAAGGLAIAVIGVIFATPIILLLAEAGNDTGEPTSSYTCAGDNINEDDTFEYGEVSQGCRTFGWVLVGVGGSALLGGILTAALSGRVGRNRQASLTPSLVLGQDGGVSGASALFSLRF